MKKKKKIQPLYKVSESPVKHRHKIVINSSTENFSQMH